MDANWVYSVILGVITIMSGVSMWLATGRQDMRAEIARRLRGRSAKDERGSAGEQQQYGTSNGGLTALLRDTLASQERLQARIEWQQERIRTLEAQLAECQQHRQRTRTTTTTRKRPTTKQ